MGCKTKMGAYKPKGGSSRTVRVGIAPAVALFLLLAPILNAELVKASDEMSIEIDWLVPIDATVSSIFFPQLEARITFNGEPIDSSNQLSKMVKLDELGSTGIFTRSANDPEIWKWKGYPGKLKEGSYTLTASFIDLHGKRHSAAKELWVTNPVVYLKEAKWDPSNRDALIWEFQVRSGGRIVDGDGRLILDFHPTGGLLIKEPNGIFTGGIGEGIKLSMKQSETLREKLAMGNTKDGCTALLQVSGKNYPINAYVIGNLPREPSDKIVFRGETVNIDISDIFAKSDMLPKYIVIGEDTLIDFDIWTLLWEELERTGLLSTLLESLTKDDLSLTGFSGDLINTMKDLIGGITRDLENPETFNALMGYGLELEDDLHQYVKDKIAPGGIFGNVADNSESLFDLVLEVLSDQGIDKRAMEAHDMRVRFKAGEPGMYIVLFTNTDKLTRNLDESVHFAVEVADKAEIRLPDMITAGEPFTVQVVTSERVPIKGATVTMGNSMVRTDEWGLARLTPLGGRAPTIQVRFRGDQHFAFENFAGEPTKIYTTTLAANQPPDEDPDPLPPPVWPRAPWVLVIVLLVAVIVAALVAVVVRRRRI